MEETQIFILRPVFSFSDNDKRYTHLLQGASFGNLDGKMFVFSHLSTLGGT